MRISLVAIVYLFVAGVIGGCGKQTQEGTERGPCYGNGTCNEGLACMSSLCVKKPSIVEAADKIATFACACTDAACVEKAQEDLMELFREAEEPTQADQEKLTKSMERMGTCVAKFPSRLVSQIDALADEACACKDMACAEKVQSKLMNLVKDAKAPSKSDQETIMKAMERMGECMAKIAVPH